MQERLAKSQSSNQVSAKNFSTASGGYKVIGYMVTNWGSSGMEYSAWVTAKNIAPGCMNSPPLQPCDPFSLSLYIRVYHTQTYMVRVKIS